MGYDLHITRAAWWTRSEEYPVAQDEWQAVADVWPGMAVEGGVDFKDTSRVPVYALHGVGEHPPSFYWRPGQVVVYAYYADTGEIARIAQQLGARLIGDDHEEYLPDGSVVDPGAQARQNLLARPLRVDEVASAWRSLLDWEDCEAEGPVARQALRAFTAIGMREVETPDEPDADMLLYQFGVHSLYGESAFSLSMVRQFIRADASCEDDLVQIECELLFRPIAELTALGKFGEWAPIGARDLEFLQVWLDSLSDRPEWRVFDQLAPVGLTINGEAVYNSGLSRQRPEVR
jgi:hypothetical protein